MCVDKIEVRDLRNSVQRSKVLLIASQHTRGRRLKASSRRSVSALVRLCHSDFDQRVACGRPPFERALGRLK